MNALQQKMSEFAAKVVKDALVSGLSWDEAVAALGLAARVLAHGDAIHSDAMDSVEHARMRLDQGFAHVGEGFAAACDMSDLLNCGMEADNSLSDSEGGSFAKVH